MRLRDSGDGLRGVCGPFRRQGLSDGIRLARLRVFSMDGCLAVVFWLSLQMAVFWLSLQMAVVADGCLHRWLTLQMVVFRSETRQMTPRIDFPPSHQILASSRRHVQVHDETTVCSYVH